jgi:hypothetical protein
MPDLSVTSFSGSGSGSSVIFTWMRHRFVCYCNSMGNADL